MQSDITIEKGNTVLIIDAKYYTHTTQTQYDVHTLHSGNLYQIFTYIKKIRVKTLNLNGEFSKIAAQRNAIVDEHFGQ